MRLDTHCEHGNETYRYISDQLSVEHVQFEREELCLVGAKKLPALLVRELMGGAKPERTHRQEVT